MSQLPQLVLPEDLTVSEGQVLRIWRYLKEELGAYPLIIQRTEDISPRQDPRLPNPANSSDKVVLRGYVFVRTLKNWEDAGVKHLRIIVQRHSGETWITITDTGYKVAIWDCALQGKALYACIPKDQFYPQLKAPHTGSLHGAIWHLLRFRNLRSSIPIQTVARDEIPTLLEWDGTTD